jgi:hypothetical protein
MSFNEAAIQMNTLVELVDDRIFPHCTHFSLTKPEQLLRHSRCCHTISGNLGQKSPRRPRYLHRLEQKP